MVAIVWDQLDQRYFEQGVDHGVLYDFTGGAYVDGVAWNGLTAVNAEPSGAEPTKQYADNIEYLTLLSAETFSCTIEAFMAPEEFDKFDGVHRTDSGLQITQQQRPTFGFSWRTLKGTAADETAGYVLHFAYGCKASPSAKNYGTVNESPEPTTFSWAISTTPVSSDVATLRPTSYTKVDSTDPAVTPAGLAALEAILYGTGAVEARLPLPSEMDEILGGTP